MNTIRFFRYSSIADAVSFLILLCIAMPARTFWGHHFAVTYAGRAHGFIFVVFCILLFFAMLKAKWSLKTAFLLGLSAVVPALPFFIDPWLKKEQQRIAGIKKEN